MIKRYLVLLIVLSLVAASGGAAIYFYRKAQNYQRLLADPQAAGREEIAAVVSRVGRFMDLPEEEPTIATVTDAAGLASQPFFLRAQNGDRILVYMQALKAILYRPSTNRVIEVAPLVVNPGNPATPSAKLESSEQSTPSATDTQTVP